VKLNDIINNTENILLLFYVKVNKVQITRLAFKCDMNFIVKHIKTYRQFRVHSSLFEPSKIYIWYLVHRLLVSYMSRDVDGFCA
jgi:hypothetical protein